MLKTLIAREIRNNLLNRRFVLAYSICTLLIVVSAATMFSDYVGRKRDNDVSTGIADRARSGLRRYAGFEVFRPPQLAAMFAAGGERDADMRGPIDIMHRPLARGDLRRNPLTSFFPAPDLLFIVGTVITLLTFMLTFDSVSGEFERGTMKVLLAGPAPRDQVFLAKWLGGAISLAFPYVTSLALVAAMLALGSGLTIRPDQWLSLAAIGTMGLLYIATVFSVALMVSAVMRESATAMLALVALWGLLVILVPAISTPTAWLIVRPSTIETVETSLRVVPDPGMETPERTARWKTCYDKIAGELGASPDELRNPSTPALERIAEQAYQVCHREAMMHYLDTFETALRAVDRQEQRVHRLSRWLNRLSPYGCLRNAAVTVAGTGHERDVAIRDWVHALSKATLTFICEFSRNPSEDWRFAGSSLPRFGPSFHSTARRIESAVLDIGLMALMCVLAFMAGHAAFVRREAV